MIINTKYGSLLPTLPDNAKCKVSNVSPLEMARCPIYQFDDYGLYCVPSICNEYEGDKEYECKKSVCE